MCRNVVLTTSHPRIPQRDTQVTSDLKIPFPNYDCYVLRLIPWASWDTQITSDWGIHPFSYFVSVLDISRFFPFTEIKWLRYSFPITLVLCLSSDTLLGNQIRERFEYLFSYFVSVLATSGYLPRGYYFQADLDIPRHSVTD